MGLAGTFSQHKFSLLARLPGGCRLGNAQFRAAQVWAHEEVVGVVPRVVANLLHVEIRLELHGSKQVESRVLLQ
jgi:hypothetical protein